LRSLGYANGEGRTFISSTKGLTGHGLSYSGVLEAAICALSIREGIVPGNAALEDPDEAFDGLRLPTRTENHPLHLVLNNSSGFGGTNVCHLFSRP
jgi:3-oxoacyl-(acyl-carrier-protein) synthase